MQQAFLDCCPWRSFARETGSRHAGASGDDSEKSTRGASRLQFVPLALGASFLVAATQRVRRSRETIARHGVKRSMTLDGYPIHGAGYYWTLSQCTEAVRIFVPIADDVTASDIIFNCRDGTLKLGLTPDKGGLVISDELLYPVDTVESYYVLESGEYGERCIAVWLSKLSADQDWYSYDRFQPVTERFLTMAEKNRAALTFKITKKAFLDITVDDKPFGRIVIGLYGDLVPRTVENFRSLCTGDKGVSSLTGHPLSYKNSRFHRLIPGFCIQGGQTFEDEDGSGGESIYGLSFEDECLRLKYRVAGMVAMANGGPHTNGSQFFITTAPAEHLKHTCVCFGEVMEGMEVVNALSGMGKLPDGDPMNNVVISECGELELALAEVGVLGNKSQYAGPPRDFIDKGFARIEKTLKDRQSRALGAEQPAETAHFG